MPSVVLPAHGHGSHSCSTQPPALGSRPLWGRGRGLRTVGGASGPSAGGGERVVSGGLDRAVGLARDAPCSCQHPNPCPGLSCGPTPVSGMALPFSGAGPSSSRDSTAEAKAWRLQVTLGPCSRGPLPPARSLALKLRHPRTSSHLASMRHCPQAPLGGCWRTWRRRRGGEH